MEIVTVKNKFQIVISQHVREQVHIEVGDLLEVTAEGGKITFTPKTLIDRHLAEGMDDASAKEAIAALEARTKRYTE